MNKKKTVDLNEVICIDFKSDPKKGLIDVFKYEKVRKK